MYCILCFSHSEKQTLQETHNLFALSFQQNNTYDTSLKDGSTFHNSLWKVIMTNFIICHNFAAVRVQLLSFKFCRWAHVALEVTICRSLNWPHTNFYLFLIYIRLCHHCVFKQKRGYAMLVIKKVWKKRKIKNVFVRHPNMVEQQLFSCATTIWTRNDVNTGRAKTNTLLTRLKLQPQSPKSCNVCELLMRSPVCHYFTAHWNQLQFKSSSNLGYQRWGGSRSLMVLPMCDCQTNKFKKHLAVTPGLIPNNFSTHFYSL